ncbi:hypothetical protein [Actinosynnema sp. NPDC020468]|uniref:3-hydroxyacyl-ACP dehydratase FabZ family protein n=1 Tax=Actinosynnema sp. NPDC020468 TaxID=3154488 RepID=UPI0033FFF96B
MTTPLAGEVVVTAVTPTPDGPVVTARYTVAPDEPVLAGHYRAFPIFPGVCLVECVHRAAVASSPGAVLSTMDSVRLLAPVFPGDTVDITLSWRDSLSCKASVAVDSRAVASVALTYRSTL